MEKIVLLGTAGAVTNSERDNVSLVYCAQKAPLGAYHCLLECGGSAAHKLAKLGIPYETLKDIIITHTHLDHLYGLPGLIFSMIYRDRLRTQPLRIYCPEPDVGALTALIELSDLAAHSSFPFEVRGVPMEESALVLENQYARITSTPVEHAPDVPTIGIKIHSKPSNRIFVYSSDTGYSERFIHFAQQADILCHECAGLAKHPIPALHSTALQVGLVAEQSAAKQLVLVHLDTVANDDPAEIVAEVRQHFSGEVSVASDFDEYAI